MKELFSQRLSRCRRQGVDVLVIRYTQFVGKEASNLLFGFVQCRGDQVEGSFFRQLDDVFAQVGFVDVDPLGLQCRVETQFLGHHGLAFGCYPDVAGPHQFRHDFVGLSGVFGEVDEPAGFGDVLFQKV